MKWCNICLMYYGLRMTIDASCIFHTNYFIFYNRDWNSNWGNFIRYSARDRHTWNIKHEFLSNYNIGVSLPLLIATYFTKIIFNIDVARVVKSKLAFIEWSFHNLVIVIKLCKIRYLNLDKVLLFRRNQLFVWKSKNFGELQLPQSLIFFAEILHTFPT